MTQSRESMETVHLTIELLHRIPRERKITAPELQQQLASDDYQRDLSSIQRHLKQITEHFDVECDDRGTEAAPSFLARPVLMPVSSL